MSEVRKRRRVQVASARNRRTLVESLNDRSVSLWRLQRPILSMGGKGGTGKSTVMAGIAEYLQSIGVTPEKIDLDWENKKEGSLQSWFPDATKVDIREPKAYDILLRRAFLTSTDVVLADLGAAHDGCIDGDRWFVFSRHDDDDVWSWRQSAGGS